MEYVILGLLLMRPMSIYDVTKSFERGISLFYSASSGSIQSALKKLLDKGYVHFETTVDNGRNKKIHFVTDEGRAAFLAWMKAPLSEGKMEVEMLAKVYFLGLITERSERRALIEQMKEAVERVEQQLIGQEQQLATMELPEPYRELFHFQLKTLHYGIGTHQFAKRWLAEIEREL